MSLGEQLTMLLVLMLTSKGVTEGVQKSFFNSNCGVCNVRIPPEGIALIL
jgi:Na+/H+-dicarboxylate symporter